MADLEIEQSQRPPRTTARIVGAVLALGCFGVLGIAAALSAEAEGHGTHQQLGMPPCMWAERFDIPCATCGMTTSFAHAADGDLVGSFINQPMGAVLAVLTACVFWGASHVAFTGSRLGEMAGRLVGGKLLIIGGILMVLAWVYKIITWQG